MLSRHVRLIFTRYACLRYKISLEVYVAVWFVDIPRSIPSQFHIYDVPLDNVNSLCRRVIFGTAASESTTETDTVVV
jgi:hypothetical protein